MRFAHGFDAKSVQNALTHNHFLSNVECFVEGSGLHFRQGLANVAAKFKLFTIKFY